MHITPIQRFFCLFEFLFTFISLSMFFLIKFLQFQTMMVQFRSFLYVFFFFSSITRIFSEPIFFSKIFKSKSKRPQYYCSPYMKMETMYKPKYIQVKYLLIFYGLICLFHYHFQTPY